ncbi:hypothetical protein LJR125_003374 [Pseudoxanthomonas sp. LjRoot125]|uniref:hypothetical protein n=1 Tax=Pseudoxanthomonas sp. LjRoot125 TaxID=3342258 RepID=UPI003E11B0BB
MMVSYMLAAVISFSSGPEMTSDVCVPPAWPERFEINRSVTFADLQELYLREVPAALMPEQAILQAESVARDSSHDDWAAQAGAIGVALYQTQSQKLEAHCGQRLDSQHGAAELIERAYARVLAHTNLRHDSAAAAKLLPDKFSINLTPRVAIVGLSVRCSESTPALASFLARASIPCGQSPRSQGGR